MINPIGLDPGQHRPAKSWMLLAIAIAIIMVDGYDLQSIGFVAPEIARAWSLQTAAFGPVFAAGLAGTIPGAIGAGLAARRLGRRRTLAIAMLIFGGGTLACSSATGLATLAVFRCIVGVGLGAAVPLVLALVADHAPARFRASQVVMAMCGQPVGAIAGAALCAWLMPRFGWRSAFVLGGILPLILIPTLILLPGTAEAAAPAPGGRDEGSPPSRWGILARAHLAKSLLLWVSAVLAVLLTYLIVNWLPGILRESGHPIQTSLRAVSLVNAGGIVGGLACSALIDRLGPFRVVPIAYLLGAASLTSLAGTRTMPLALYATCFFSGVTIGGASMCIGMMAVLLYPSSLRAISAGWTLAIGRFGAAAGSIVIGIALAAGLSGGSLFYVAGALAILAAGCAAMLGFAQGAR